MLVRRGTGGGGRGGVAAIGRWGFGERDDCGGRLDGGVEVGRRGVFGIVVRIVRYRRLSHTWEVGRRRGEGEQRGKEKKKGWRGESEAWGKIKRETCNFDLFYDLWKGQLVK